jgi:hypothetical protein
MLGPVNRIKHQDFLIINVKNMYTLSEPFHVNERLVIIK